MDTLLGQATVKALPNTEPETVAIIYDAWEDATNAGDLCVLGMAANKPERLNCEEAWATRLAEALEEAVLYPNGPLGPETKIQIFPPLIERVKFISLPRR